MKLKHLLFLLLIAPSFSQAQAFYKPGFFVLKGQVKNFKEPVFDFGMTTFFNNSTQSVKVLTNGNFEQKFPLQHRQNIYLIKDSDIVVFTVQDKDTLTLQWDDDDFKNTLSVKGANTGRTKELQLQIKVFTEFWKPFADLDTELYEKKNKLTNDKKVKLINDLYNRQVKAIISYSDSITENINHTLTGLYFQYTNLLKNEKLIPQFKLEFFPDTSWKTIPNFDMAAPFYDYRVLNETWFWNVPDYRSFIYDYTRFYKPFNSYINKTGNNMTKFNPTRDEYHLAQSNIYLTNIKDWFITKSIMDGFADYSFGDAEKVYKQFIDSCSTPFFKDTLQKYYTAIKRLKPGNPAPGFSLKNEKGQMVSLSDFKGKVVYIDFWGVGCGPCIYDIKTHIPDLHTRYKGKEVIFINICVDSKEKDWKDALAKYQLDGINLIAEGWTINPVCKLYNINGLPHYVLIDKNGKISNSKAPRAGTLNNSTNNPIDQLLK